MKEFSYKKALIKLHYLCNQNCVFCWHHQFGERIVGASYTKQGIIDRIKEAKKLGLDMLVLTGGEPTIHEHFMQFATMIHDAGLLLGLATNAAMLAYPQKVKHLKSMGFSFAHVSFYSYDQGIDKTITKSDLYDASVNGMRNMIMEEIPFLVNIVVHRLNINQLLQTIDFLHGLGVRNLKLNLVEPTGNAAINSSIIPRFSEGVTSIKAAFSHAKKKGMDVIYDGLPLCTIPGYESAYHDLSGMGIGYISEAFEDRFYPVHHGNRRKLQLCTSCTKNKECDGIYKRYFEHYSEDEIANVLVPYR
ncbi:MAG: radical SAM protein [Nanoarchaeota archaeon]